MTSYSAQFMVRLEPSLHKAIALRAKLAGKSLNAWVQEMLRGQLGPDVLTGRPSG